MATVNVSVKYRPVRIGFLVREGSIEDLVTAAGINTLLWGGIRNPVIPVGADGTFAARLLDLFSVDVLYAVSASPELERVIEAYPYLREPHHYGERIFYEDWHTKKKVLAYLDAVNIIKLYWEREFKHSSPKSKSNCALVRWDANDPLASLFSVQFGYFPSQYDLATDFERAFVNGLRARELKLVSEKVVGTEIAKRVKPIALTGVELTGYGGGWRSDDGIYVGDEGNFTDLVSFWNLRAAGADIEFLPKKHVKRLEPFIREHLLRLDKRESANPNIEEWIAVHYLPDSHDEVIAILKGFKTKKNKVLSSVGEVSWNGLNVSSVNYYFGWDTSLATVEESFGKPVVTLGLPEKKFLISDNHARGRNVENQSLVVSLDFFYESGYLEHTLKPPFIRSLNEFYSREIVFDPWILRVEREGIALIKKTDDRSVNLYPLSHQVLIEKIFELAGIEAKRSQPGLLAFQIIKSMREFSPLDACRVFKVRGARKLLSTLKSNERISWNDALRIIGTDNFDKFKSLYIDSRETRELTPADVLLFLLKKRVLVPRLRLEARLFRFHKKFKCEECGLESKILMADYEGHWRCPYCDHEHYLPPFIGAGFRDKSMWYFRKSGLFAKDNNQEGAIPVILSLLVFLRILDLGKFIYSTSLNLKGDKTCETDLCVFQYRRGDEIEVGIGECKSEKGCITAQDVLNLKGVREKLMGIGLRCYLVFAKTADTFYADELDLFRKLKEENVPFVIFTNREMDPYNPYWEKENENVPVRYPFTLSELASNSEFIYLSRIQDK